MNISKGRFYTPLTLCLGLLFGVLSLRLTIAMISTLYGPFTFGAASPPETLRYGFWRVDDDVVVDRDSFARRVEAWQRILVRAREEGVELVEGTRLEALIEQGVSVVLVPSGRTLSTEEGAALERFVAQGGGALIVGSLGTTAEDGAWRGYALMKRLLGVDEVVPRSRDASAALEIGRPGALLSSRFGRKERLPLIREAGVAAVANPRAELLWSRVAGPEAKAVRAASLRRRLGRGRIAWLGAGPETAVVRSAGTLRTHDALYLDALKWSARRPVVTLLASGDEVGAGDTPAPPLRMRENVHAKVRVEGRHRLHVEVTNRSRQPATDIVLRLFFNRETGQARVERTMLGQTAPEVERRPGGNSLDLRLAEVAGGSSLSLLVDTPETGWQQTDWQ